MKVLGIMLQPTFKEIAGNMVKAFNDSGIKLLCISEYGAIVKKPDGSIEAFCFDRKTE